MNIFRHSIIGLDYLTKLKGINNYKDIRDKRKGVRIKRKNEFLKINGVLVKITSQRYELFKNNLSCVSCGII